MKNFSKIKERIRQFSDIQGEKITNIYQKTGISDGTLSNSSGLTEDNLLKFFSKYPEINPDWLLTGKGNMIRESKPLELIEEKQNNTIPLIPIEAMAGNGGSDVSITEHDIQARYLVPEFKGADFMIPVKGSSMYPKYNSGDIIACRIIKERSFFQWGRVYVIHHRDQGTMIKRLFKGTKEGWLECRSDNEKYPPFEVPEEGLTNIALVIGVIRLE